jgi:homocysteine S-methyltransferase
MRLKSWIFSTSESPSILLLDGGVSTHLEHLLEEANQPKFQHRVLWSSSLLLTEPGRILIQQGHLDWLEAGSNIVTTVTYQCHYGVRGQQESMPMSDAQVDQLLTLGVKLAQEALTSMKGKSNYHSYIVASSGCYGAALADGSEYTGNYPDITHEGLTTFHYRKARRLAQSHPDGLAIETIPNIQEIHAILDALSEIEDTTTDIACWISFACQNGTQLNDGTPLEDALQILRSDKRSGTLIQAIGINCCDTLYIESLLTIITKDMAIHGPRRGIVLYPNSGEGWDAKAEKWKKGTGCTNPRDFVQRLVNAISTVEKTWRKYDTDSNSKMPKMMIGGCCRTSPTTISELRLAVDNWEQNERKFKKI